MKVIQTARDLPWLPAPSEVSLVLDDRLPPAALITSALVLAFDGDKLLMTNLHARGWDIPGGHREPDETPEQAMRREVLEEAGATLTQVQLLGYQWIRILGPTPPGYRYPCPESYQMLYVGQVEALQEFPGTTEARSRALFAPEEARSLRWVQQNRPMYEAALQLIRSRRQEARGIQP